MPGQRTISAVLGLSFVCAAAHAGTTSLSFFQIPSSNGNVDISSQLEVLVDAVAGDPGSVDFTFSNNIGVDSAVSEVYFDDAAGVLSSGSLFSQTGASFSYGSAAPPDLPGGNSISPQFNVTSDFKADAQGPPSRGLSTASDQLVLRFSLASMTGLSDVMSALESGDLRIGMHVKSIGDNGGSDSYVSLAPTAIIPTPAAAGLGALGLGGVVGVRRRRRC